MKKYLSLINLAAFLLEQAITNISLEGNMLKLKSRLTLLSLCSFFLFLSACATVTESSLSPNNKKVYGIDCSGKMVPMRVCYEKAAKLCPRGYRIISASALAPFEHTPAITPFILGTKIGEAIPGVKKGITVECN